MTESAHTPDEFWMAQALKLAEKGRCTTTPNPNVGCVIVKDGKKISEGWHQKAGTPHAEVHALAMAGAGAEGATAYVTLEPCSHYGRTPPCAQALINAGIASVVCAMKDPNPLVAGKGLSMLEAVGIQTRSGVLQTQAEQLNAGFLKRMRTGLPWVTVKMASSLDGGTALANGASQWITGPQARRDVQHGRAESCAIVTGIGSVLADDPSMNVRLPGTARQPLRLVLDSHLRTPVNAKLIENPGRTLLLHCSDAPQAKKMALTEAGFECVEMVTGENGSIDLSAFLNWCGEAQLNRLWVEAGAHLAGSFARQGLVDEFILYQAAKFLGSGTSQILSMELQSLDQALDLTVEDVRFVGKDIRWRLRIA
ncbi:MAG: bifunctional diaminohydroxyphosphoribosylaminopyrimidine deaminase/5-amino-6-(5-phosphoribosylamino)uracil reductase RibD [Reinekea sp.]|jgi:diaminohydroxyphosphoribosylaminopyrimidine deaminase / 5-amino-6-(5-phosphoribosylamino)uracil reductase